MATTECSAYGPLFLLRITQNILGARAVKYIPDIISIEYVKP